MELIERDEFLGLLQSAFTAVATGEGHCIFICGEAGIGKTSLVKAFRRTLKKEQPFFQGTCDALFTPRPLAPLYDIIPQLKMNPLHQRSGMTERTRLFGDFFQDLSNRSSPVVIVFEDIHWADEATLDFIKFLSRRITQTSSLFICTYRDNEISSHHPLRNVLGQLAPDSFTRIQLPVLSKQAVEKLAVEKGYSGENVYSISGGNPFYVNEILASYSEGVPENIRDSILSVYNRQEEATRQLWENLAVLPTGFEISYLQKMDIGFTAAAETAIDSGILIVKEGQIWFKHELYRRTIETSLSPLKRIALNKKILDLFRDRFEEKGEIERIIHHAKNANEYDTVVKYAPLAARQAAAVGAHIEAARLYLSAIEYYQSKDSSVLIQLYESYAYECYLTNQIKDAIIYTGKSLQLWKEKGDEEKTGNSLRFLSRLWWFDGSRKNAEDYAMQAIAILDKQPDSATKAMAYSNMSQLKMLSEETAPCIFWGEKAIAIAKDLGNQDILCHALNNVGAVRMKTAATEQEGRERLQESLDIALKNRYHEHAARAYTNLGSGSVTMKNYVPGKKIIDEGIQYCEENDLDSWTNYMSSLKARILLETGQWAAAYRIADNLLKNERQAGINKIVALAVIATIHMRRGNNEALPLLLKAKESAFETKESQRIVPALVALLEYEWIYGTIFIEATDIEQALEITKGAESIIERNDLAFWLRMAGRGDISLLKRYAGYEMNKPADAIKAATAWKEKECPYQQALALFKTGDDGKRKAIAIVHELGATAVYEKLKMDMRSSGIKSIPRGARKTTLSNPAQLTDRELDIIQLLKEGLRNKEIAARLFISAKTVDHHISSILFKLDVNTRAKAVQEAARLQILK